MALKRPRKGQLFTVSSVGRGCVAWLKYSMAWSTFASKQETIVSIDFGVTNKFYQGGEFAETESINKREAL